jgi:hypothetical protein
MRAIGDAARAAGEAIPAFKDQYRGLSPIGWNRAMAAIAW